MQLTLTEEQALLRQSASDWLAAHLPYKPRAHGQPPPLRDSWKDFAAAGWLGLPFPEQLGGSGCGPSEAFALCESLGRHLVAQPYIPAVVVGGRLILALADKVQAERWIPGLADGSERLALAHDEPGSRSPWTPRDVRATRHGDAWVLNGAKQMVEGTEAATLWLVTATIDDGQQKVFAVSPAVSGVRRESYACIHGAQAMDLMFEQVELSDSAVLGHACDDVSRNTHDVDISRCLAEGIIAACWAASGAMAALVEQTASHVTTRNQFGKPLSAFQAVQHSLAEMLVQSTEAQAMCELAAAQLQQDGRRARSIALAARVKVARAASDVAKRAVQLHGAMGVCDELPVAAAYRWLEAFQLHNGRWQQYCGLLADSLLADGRYRHSAVLGDGAAA